MHAKTIAAALAAAALVPTTAFASHGGGNGGGSGKGQTNYELRGTLSGYVAATSGTPGSITILVTGGNKAGRAFAGDTLTFALNAGTRVEAGLTGITDGDAGEIQVRAASAADVTTLQQQAPRRVEDESASDD
jgi:hypothetical protein